MPLAGVAAQVIEGTFTDPGGPPSVRSGRSTVNVLPSVGADLTVTVAPWLSVIADTIARPRPEPGIA